MHPPPQATFQHCCEISTKAKFLKSLFTGLEMVLPCNHNNGRTGKPAGSPACPLINKLGRRLAAQQLRLRASNAGGMGSTPGWGT